MKPISLDSLKKSTRPDTFSGVDFYAIDDLLGAELLMIRSAVRKFVQVEVSPIIEDCFEKAAFPHFLVPKMGDLGLFGPTISTIYGGAGLDYLAYGIMMQELERGDSGMRSTASVQGSLVMYPIEHFGSEAQKKHYLPLLASGKMLGCFGLTEPNHGSNPSGMECTLRRSSNGYILNGNKMWISNAPFADIAIVWARNDEGKVMGVLLERGMEGFSTPEIEGKWSLRASATGELVFQDVFIPDTNVLPLAKGMAAPMQCLDSARYGISWGAIGAAMDCYETARNYAIERKQFGKPLAGFQLTQKKLAEMLTDITQAQLLSWRLGTLFNQGKVSTAQISMAKRSNVAMALRIAHEARQMLGGMGITQSYGIMRHAMNLESVITYEGTHDIHLLILGKEITGLQAFQ